MYLLMAMALKKSSKDCWVVFHGLVWLVVVILSLSLSHSHTTETDIYCLKTLKESVEDPLNYLSSWDFSNKSDDQLGFICNFVGVECWNPNENRVLNINLSNMGLRGKFPLSIQNCTSLTGFNLSSNNFSGSIPTDVSSRLPFVTSLDLSDNSLSGEIPRSLANCSYLNVLELGSNRLTGNIPPQLGLLQRLRTFSVANNMLRGQVPIFRNNGTATAESYANNSGLCGGPLPACLP